MGIARDLFLAGSPMRDMLASAAPLPKPAPQLSGIPTPIAQQEGEPEGIAAHAWRALRGFGSSLTQQPLETARQAVEGIGTAVTAPLEAVGEKFNDVTGGIVPKAVHATLWGRPMELLGGKFEPPSTPASAAYEELVNATAGLVSNPAYLAVPESKVLQGVMGAQALSSGLQELPAPPNETPTERAARLTRAGLSFGMAGLAGAGLAKDTHLKRGEVVEPPAPALAPEKTQAPLREGVPGMEVESTPAEAPPREVPPEVAAPLISPSEREWAQYTASLPVRTGPYSRTPVGEALRNTLGDPTSTFARGETPYEAQRFPNETQVLIEFGDGSTHMDAVKGLNMGHALRRAKENWPNAIKITALDPSEVSVGVRGVENPHAAFYDRLAEDTGLRTYFAERGQAALERLKTRGSRLSGETQGGAPGFIEGLGAITDLADYGASRIAVGVIDFGRWSGEMVRQFGDRVKPHLRNLWEEAHRVLQTRPEARLAERRVAVEPVPTERRTLDRRARLAEEFPTADPALLDRVHAAETDPLTGLPNKLALERDAAKHQGAVATFDIGGMKYINDNLGGHPAGDALLKAFGDALKAEPVESYRSGPSGDEFYLLADTPEAADAAAQRVRERFQNATFRVTRPDGQVVEYTGGEASHGVAPISPEQPFSEALSAADRDLYERRQLAQDLGLRVPRGSKPRSLAEVPAGGEQVRGDLAAEGGEPQPPAAPALPAAEPIKPTRAFDQPKQSEPVLTSPPSVVPKTAPQRVEANVEIPSTPIQPESPAISKPITPKPPHVEALHSLLSQAKPKLLEQAKLYSTERGKRFAQAGTILKGGKGEGSFWAALSSLRGELPKVSFEPIRHGLSDEQVTALYEHIKEQPGLSTIDQLRAGVALGKLLDPETPRVPQASEVALLERAFGSEVAEMVRAKKAGAGAAAEKTRKEFVAPPPAMFAPPGKYATQVGLPGELGLISERPLPPLPSGVTFTPPGRYPKQLSLEKRAEVPAPTMPTGKPERSYPKQLELGGRPEVAAPSIPPGRPERTYPKQLVFGEKPLPPLPEGVDFGPPKREGTQIELAATEGSFGPTGKLEPDIKTRQRKWSDLSAGEKAVEILGIPRTAVVGLDLGTTLRQGLMLGVHAPKKFASTLIDMFHALASAPFAKDLEKDILHRPTANQQQADGLYIHAREGGTLAGREDTFQSRLLMKIPGIGRLYKATERGSTLFLDKLRADIYDSDFKALREAGNKDPNLGKGLATYINTMSGRGDLGALERAAPLLNTVLFSPHLLKARTDYFNPAFYKKLPTAVKKQAIMDVAKLAGVGISLLTIAKAGGADVQDDPHSADFGKIRVGKVRLDPWGGFQQWIRFFAQLGSSERLTLGGMHTHETRADIAGRFLEQKLSPQATLALHALRGRSAVSKGFDVSSEAYERLTPLIIQDIIQLVKTDPEVAAAAIPFGFLGGGVGVYDEPTEPTPMERYLKDEMERLGYQPEEPSAHTTIKGRKVELEPDEVRTLKKAQMKAADEARRVIRSSHYRRLSDTDRKYELERIFQKWRSRGHQRIQSGVKARYRDLPREPAGPQVGLGG